MHEVIDVRGSIHEANVERIAARVLNTVGARPGDDDIVRAIHYPAEKLNNMKLIQCIINGCFPSPSLDLVNNPVEVEDVVIEALVREHMSMKNHNGRITTH